MEKELIKMNNMTRGIDYNIFDTLTKAVEIGYKLALSDFGKRTRYISERKAAAKYGGAMLEHWAKNGLIDRIKTSDAQNGKITYDEIQLEIAKKATFNG